MPNPLLASRVDLSRPARRRGGYGRLDHDRTSLPSSRVNFSEFVVSLDPAACSGDRLRSWAALWAYLATSALLSAPRASRPSSPCGGEPAGAQRPEGFTNDQHRRGTGHRKHRLAAPDAGPALRLVAAGPRARAHEGDQVQRSHPRHVSGAWRSRAAPPSLRRDAGRLFLRAHRAYRRLCATRKRRSRQPRRRPNRWSDAGAHTIFRQRSGPG